MSQEECARLREGVPYVNHLTPNDHFSGRTAPLTSRCCIFLFIQQIYILNILNMLHTLCFFLFKMPFISLCYLFWFLYYSHFKYRMCSNLKENSGAKGLKYTDITQNTYVQSWMVTEIMAREKCGLLAGPRTVPVSWQSYPCPSLSVVSYDGSSTHASHKLHMYFLQGVNL